MNSKLLSREELYTINSGTVPEDFSNDCNIIRSRVALKGINVSHYSYDEVDETVKDIFEDKKVRIAHAKGIASLAIEDRCLKKEQKEALMNWVVGLVESIPKSIIERRDITVFNKVIQNNVSLYLKRRL